MNNTIDEAFAPFSRWVNRALFNEPFGRTLSQRVEDDYGIPKENFHGLLIIAGALGLAAYLDSRN